jgi:hypothetical protein
VEIVDAFEVSETTDGDFKDGEEARGSGDLRPMRGDSLEAALLYQDLPVATAFSADFFDAADGADTVKSAMDGVIVFCRRAKPMASCL